jgi:hypothetical protein
MLAHVSDEVIRKSFAQYGFTRVGQVPASMYPTLNRLYRIAFSPLLRYSLGQSENILDFHRLLAEQRSVIINLNTPSPEAKRLLGCFYTVYAEMGARSRGEIPAEQRKGKHVLILDEFQNFVAQSGDAMASILEECRKFGLFLCLAHQHWKQVPDELLGAMRQCEIALTFHLDRPDAKISEEVLGFPFIERLPKPAEIDLLNPLPTRRQYYSRSEQKDKHIDNIVALRKREVIARLPGENFYRLHTLDVDERDVKADVLASVENSYLKLYFQSEETIKQRFQNNLNVSLDNGDLMNNNGCDEAQGDGDDYDLF